MPPFREETNVKRTKEFRKLQQKVMTYQRRNLKLDDDDITTLMIDYVEFVKARKAEEDELAKEIENKIIKRNHEVNHD